MGAKNAGPDCVLLTTEHLYSSHLFSFFFLPVLKQGFSV